MSEDHDDNLLGFFLSKTEEQKFGISITLCVRGAIVAGTLIDKKKYFEQTMKFLHMKPTDLDKDATAKQILEFEDLINDLKKEFESVQSDQEIKYIHLKNVSIRNASDGSKTSSPLWRGKISSIDGFSLGVSHNTHEIPT